MEGQWDDDLSDRTSVRRTLELLERLRVIQFIHKDVATQAELDHYLGRWTLRANAGYSVGYFAMHGTPAKLVLSRRSSVTLHHIAPELFRKLVFGAALDARREVAVLAELGAPPDHPVSIRHPQGAYLTGLHLFVGGGA